MVKLICERDALKTALSHVASRARAKTEIPILKHVLLDGAGKSVSLAATDLDTRCVATCAAEIATEGAITVHADSLSRLVEGLPMGSQITLETKADGLHLTCGRSRYKLPTLPAEDFPDWTGVADGSEIALTSADAKRLFGEPSPAVGTEATRIYLCGGHLSRRGDSIAITATNGISLVRVALPNRADLQSGCIIPSPAMSEIVKLAKGGDMVLKLDSQKIEVSIGNVVFSSKLIDATFPDADRVIPQKSDTYITVDRSEFISAFKRLASLAEDSSTINIRWKPGAPLDVSLSGNGSGAETVACECDIDAAEIAFSPRILGDMLDVVSGEVIQLHIAGTNSPMLIVDPDDPALTIIAMPCKGRG